MSLWKIPDLLLVNVCCWSTFLIPVDLGGSLCWHWFTSKLQLGAECSSPRVGASMGEICFSNHTTRGSCSHCALFRTTQSTTLQQHNTYTCVVLVSTIMPSKSVVPSAVCVFLRRANTPSGTKNMYLLT